MTLHRWSPLAHTEAMPDLAADARSRRRAPVGRRDSSAAKLRVLVVDDDPQVLGAHVRALRTHCLAAAATNAVTAVAMLEQARFDVLLTDHDMPGHSGSFLLEAASRLAPAMRRIVVSGADENVLAKVVGSGLAHEYLCKPATVESLAKAVSSARFL